MKKRLLKIIFIIFILLFFISAVVIILYFHNENRDKKQLEELKSSIIETPDVPISTDSDAKDDYIENYYLINGRRVQEKYKDVFLENDEFVGWIKIDDTNIDYPVMQSPKSRNYYLYRNFKKEYSIVGSLFADNLSDLETPSDNILIFGHHMSSNIMFTELFGYEDKEWYENHKYIYLDTLTRSAKYEVFAAVRTQIYIDPPPDTWEYYTFFNAENEERYNNYVANCIKYSTLDTGIVPKYGEKLLSLSTCAYHNNKGRLVIVARQIEETKITDNSTNLGSITTDNGVDNVSRGFDD